ncbi:MAG TPA: hypothetical protein PLZ95_08975, partial [Bryobacteraceae bacterium]|nr:hypothetical protein [Bryobacteraceae bacterium]
MERPEAKIGGRGTFPAVTDPGLWVSGRGGKGFGVFRERFHVGEEGFQADGGGEMGGEGGGSVGCRKGTFLLYLPQLIEATEEESFVGAAV